MGSSTIDNNRSSNWTIIVVTAPDQDSAYAFDFGLYIFIFINILI